MRGPTPSARLRAVVTARPSFQNSSGKAATNSTIPINAPTNDPMSRLSHDWEVIFIHEGENRVSQSPSLGLSA